MHSEANNNDYDGWLAPVWQPPISPCAGVSLPLGNTRAHQLLVLEGSMKQDVRVAVHPLYHTAPSNQSGNYSKAAVNTSALHTTPVTRKLVGSNPRKSDLPYKLMVVRQPEEQHRARYLSEGSRGAIKDRSGTSHCTIQLTGYYHPTRVELYAATGAGPLTSHPLYQLIPVSGKSANATPCQKVIATDGIECLEVILRPENSMTAVLDCMGLLKICSHDAKHNRSIKRTAIHGNTINMAQNSVRIVVRAYIAFENALPENVHIVRTETEPIRCVQQLGVPEVLKMSLTGALTKGGAELFIIGRNFDKNTKVVFREYNEDGTLGWSAEAYIDKHYLHQCHIVCTVPAYYNLYRGGIVSVTVVCASKSSHPRTFVYSAFEVEEEVDDWRPPGSPRLSVVDSLNFGSEFSERNVRGNQLLNKSAHADANPYSTAMPFFDYDGGNTNSVIGHSSSVDQVHSCPSYISTPSSTHHSNHYLKDQEHSYGSNNKSHFQRQQTSSFSSTGQYSA